VIHVGDPKMMRSTDFLNPKLNTFAIIVDAECEKCIEKLAKVDTFIQSLNREINVLVFMNTSNPEYFLRYIYKDIVFSYPLILNKNYEYEKLNKITADKQFLYALLLNSKQEIVVVGNPTYSHELEKLYRKKLNEI